MTPKSKPQSLAVDCFCCLRPLAKCIPIIPKISDTSSASELLTRHFWFQPSDVGSDEPALCGTCWNQLNEFHRFYMVVELVHKALKAQQSLPVIEQPKIGGESAEFDKIDTEDAAVKDEHNSVDFAGMSYTESETDSSTNELLAKRRKRCIMRRSADDVATKTTKKAESSSASQSQPALKRSTISRKSMNPGQTMNPRPLTVVTKPVACNSALGSTPLATGQSPVQQEQVQIVTPASPHCASIMPATLPGPDMHQAVEQSKESPLNASDDEGLLQNALEVELETQTAEEEEVSYQEGYMENYKQQSHKSLENRIIQAISKKIQHASNRTIQAVARKVDESLAKSVAELKSNFDLKIASALRVRRQDNNDTSDLNFKFSPASTVLEIEQLEAALADPTYQDEFITYMRKMIGPAGDGCNGQNTCYALVDRFFQRRVMISCSWSGGSRSDRPKYAIKNCQNIMSAFFKIIHAVNPTFSVGLMESFFKQILRNAKTRSQAKGMRQSTIHRRKRIKRVRVDNHNDNRGDDDVFLNQVLIKHEAVELEDFDHLNNDFEVDNDDKENSIDGDGSEDE
nr:uncharacterized protein LOC109404709 [Aedes albopictus]